MDLDWGTVGGGRVDPENVLRYDRRRILLPVSSKALNCKAMVESWMFSSRNIEAETEDVGINRRGSTHVHPGWMLDTSCMSIGHDVFCDMAGISGRVSRHENSERA